MDEWLFLLFKRGEMSGYVDGTGRNELETKEKHYMNDATIQNQYSVIHLTVWKPFSFELEGAASVTNENVITQNVE